MAVGIVGAQVTSGRIVDGAVTEGKIGALAVTEAKLAATVQDRIPYLAFSGAVDGEDLTGSIKVSVLDAAGVALAGRHLVRIWVSTTEYGATEPQIGLDLSGADSSAVVDTHKVGGHIVVQTDTDGEVDKVRIQVVGADTIYVMGEIGGRVYTGSVAITNPA